MIDLARQRIVVTGGAGFLGSYVVEALRARGCRDLFVPRSADYDLVNPVTCRRLMDEVRPTLLFHLAARCGGIGANRANPGSYFRDNLLMGVNIVEAAREAGVSKLIVAGTICAYPRLAPVPMREDGLWDGYPEETNAPYGLAKKMLLVQAQAYRQQYGTNAVVLFPVNLYGPRDNFDPESSHVIPALIRKIDEAIRTGADVVELWGDGTPTREFLHAADCAEGLVLAAERYDGADPVNLGTGREITIAALARLLGDLMGYRGGFAFDATRPNGQPRRCLDVSRARDRFGFEARVPLEDGLAQTIAWWRSHGGAS